MVTSTTTAACYKQDTLRYIRIELNYNIIMIDEILRKELERLEGIKPEDKKKLTQKEKLIINKSIKVIKILLAV